MSDRLIVLDVHGVIFANPLVSFIADLAEGKGLDRKQAVATWHGRLRRRFWLGRLSLEELRQQFAPGPTARRSRPSSRGATNPAAVRLGPRFG